MAFGLTADGFKIKRLDDIKTEIEQDFKDVFGDNIDLSAKTPFGQVIGIIAERYSQIWELAQDDYNSQYPLTAEGKPLDNVASITGITRIPAQFSQVTTGVARGANGTVVPAGTIISVTGNAEARFVTQADATINIVDGLTWKSAPIELLAEDTGPTIANTGTLTVIETPVAGMDSFTNTADAEVGSEEETDAALKLRRDESLQIAGSATIEAILSELRARELVEAALVFQNIYSIPDLDGRPPHSLDIVVLGDDEDDLALAIFKVIGAGIETIGAITKTVVDSQGFSQTIKFSRPDEVEIYLELDITKDVNLYPVDGDDQVEAAILAYGETLTIGEDVVIYGTKSLIAALTAIPGITDVVTRIGIAPSPTLDDNVVMAAREIAKFDSARITVNS